MSRCRCICKENPAQPWLKLTDRRCPVHSAATARAERWKALAKRYRGDAAEWRAAFEAAAAMHAGALTSAFVGRVVETSPRCPECGGPTSGTTAPPFCSWKCKRAASVFCHHERSAQVSSAASSFPGRAAPACKENGNMSGNNGMGGGVGSGAEGGT